MRSNDDTRTHKPVLLAAVLLAAAIFVVDLRLPLGVAGGVPYIAVILLSFWLPGRHFALYGAAACTVLTVVGYHLSQPGAIRWMVITNRGLAVTALWITAALVLRYKAERDHRWESDQALQQVADAMADATTPVAISYIDRRGRIQFQNKTQREWLGEAPQGMLGRPFGEVWDESSYERIQFHLASATSGRAVSFEDSLAFRDGKQRDVRAMFIPRFGRHGEVTGLDCLLADVTEARQVQEALREREAKLRTLFEKAPQGIISVGADGSILQANEMAERLFGYTRQELIGQPIEMLVPEDSRERHAVDRAGYFADPRSRPMGKGLELAACRKDSKRFPVEVSLSYYPTAGGVEGVSFVHDISERKQIEEQLLQASRRLSERIIRASPFLVYIYDLRARRLTYASPQIEQILGYAPTQIQEASHDYLNDLIHAADRPLAAALAQSSVQARDDDVLDATCRLKHKDGAWRWLTARQVVFTRAADGRPAELLGVAADITEERRIEEENRKLDSQLQQARKLESLGALAGGVAHDFSNYLHSIIGYTELVHQNLPVDSEHRGNLNEVLKASTRASEMVRKILAFGHRQQHQPQRVRLAEIVAEALGVLRPLVPPNVELRSRLDPDSGDVEADRAEIHQVVSNLCTNALQAMGKQGGVLEVTLAAMEVDQKAALTDVELRVGPYLRLTVRDEGPGVDPAIADRLFEPFVSTKSIGHGTGLGLSVVHGIVTRSGGAIRFESQSGRGSTFCVYFPRLEGQAQPPASVPASAIGGSERILLVDDEEPIARLSRKTLGRLGYQVTAVTESKKALRLFEEDPSAYDLVISDVAMPEMAGTELARKLLRIRPSVPIILASAFHHSISPQTVEELGLRRIISKPFAVSELARVVREVLDEGPAG